MKEDIAFFFLSLSILKCFYQIRGRAGQEIKFDGENGDIMVYEYILLERMKQ